MTMARWREGWALALLLVTCAAAAETRGRVEILAEAVAPTAAAPRSLRVYLPPGYAEAPQRRYPVLYLHDGQNLFDPKLSFSGVAWGVDQTLDRLIAAGEIEPIIAVGIDHAGAGRVNEYTPCCDPKHGGGGATGHIDFLVTRVKPLIDARYRSEPRRSALAGSSLGALAALHTALARPGVFEAVAGLSGSWWWNGEAVLGAIAQWPAQARPRIYLDTAQRDDALEETQRLHAALRQSGFREGRELRLVIDADGAHNEASWARRLPDALRFMFGPGEAPR